MNRRNAEDIGLLVRKFMRAEGIETPYLQYKLISSWSEVMGKGIANYTKEIFIKDQTLHVKITSAPLRQDLTMNRKMLVQKLNNHVQAQVITDIFFH